MYSAAQHIYIANSKYLENFKEQGCNVMFKYILCKLAITNRQAIYILRSVLSWNYNFVPRTISLLFKQHPLNCAQ